MNSIKTSSQNIEKLHLKQLTVHDDTGGRLALWYHVYGSLWAAKNIQTNNLNSENILSFHQFNRPPVSSWTVNCFDVYGYINKILFQYLKNRLTYDLTAKKRTMGFESNSKYKINCLLQVTSSNLLPPTKKVLANQVVPKLATCR